MPLTCRPPTRDPTPRRFKIAAARLFREGAIEPLRADEVRLARDVSEPSGMARGACACVRACVRVVGASCAAAWPQLQGSTVVHRVQLSS